MVIALVLIFVCTFFIAINHSKGYFEEQLQNNANDSATSLGLSISSKVNSKKDTTLMLSIISATFDRGYFSKISILDNSGKEIVSRFLKDDSQKVPKWFTDLLAIKNPPQSSLIVKGWIQIGKVVVQSDSQVAYLALWDTFQYLFFLFLLVTSLIVILSIISIRIAFKPLTLITKQAEEIGKKNLYTLDRIPNLQELKTLTLTMNSMVVKLKSFFAAQIEEVEKLRSEAYQDGLTGCGNRRYFFSMFTQYLSDASYFLPGYLFLFQVFGLAEFNKKNGYQAGDQIICDIGRILDKIFAHKHKFLLARLDNPSFASVILEQDRDVLASLAEEACENIYQLFKDNGHELSCFVGIVKCKVGDDASNIISEADKLIRSCQSSNKHAYLIKEEDNSLDEYSNNLWQRRVEEAIDKGKFNFYSQPVRSNKKEYHEECYIKLLSGGKEIAASLFFPIVDEFSLGGAIDRLVLNGIIKYSCESNFTINLSDMTVSDIEVQDLFIDIIKDLKKNGEVNLSFEISESTLVENMEKAKLFIDKVNALGCSVGLDRVGTVLTPLSHLSELNLAYLKLDGSLTKNIEKNTVQQDMIIKWVSLVENLEVILIASTIETESQYNFLSKLGVKYFQGNYVQSPKLISK